MPIPKPREDESQDDFIGRCMGDDVMNEEYPEKDQRAAICYQSWRKKGMAGGIERKAVSVTLKDDKPGSFIAKIATLDVVDADNDVTLPGAFPNGKTVLVSAYQHGSWQGALPVGKATIREDGNQIVAEGEFNLGTTTGREHYEAIKFLGPLQEWSYGFRALESEMGEREDKEVRLLKKVEPYEVSPVIKGAGKDTMTLSIKERKQGNIQALIDTWDSWAGSYEKCVDALTGKPGITDVEALCAWMHHEAEGTWPGEKQNTAGITFAGQAEAALAAVKALAERARALAALRQSEGRPLSKANRDRLDAVVKTLNEAAGDVKTLLDTEPIDTALADRLLLEFTAGRARAIMEEIECVT